MINKKKSLPVGSSLARRLRLAARRRRSSLEEELRGNSAKKEGVAAPNSYSAARRGAPPRTANACSTGFGCAPAPRGRLRHRLAKVHIWRRSDARRRIQNEPRLQLLRGTPRSCAAATREAIFLRRERNAMRLC